MHRENDNEEGGERGGPGGENGRDRGDHLDQTAALWEQAFYQALQELRVEFVKARIKAAWGKNLDATSKEVFTAMFEEWKEFQKQESSETQPGRDGLREALKKGLKKGPQ